MLLCSSQRPWGSWLFPGSLWALRRSDSLVEKRISHVLSLIRFDAAALTNFRGEPWAEYGREMDQLVIEIDDVEDANLLLELPRAVSFINQGLVGSGRRSSEPSGDAHGRGAVLVHCAAGMSRSVAAAVAYLLWKYPERFDPNLVVDPTVDSSSEGPGSPWQHPPPAPILSRKETASAAVGAALQLIQRSRPMAQPNQGFLEQLALWWTMGCPQDVEAHPLYQRWAYWREVGDQAAAGLAPSRLRFEDEQQQPSTDGLDNAGTSLRCKKCRRRLVTAPFILAHGSTEALPGSQPPCPHYFVEPLSWMRGELEKGQLHGRLSCPSERCGAAVGRYDWKGIRCACGHWVTPGLSLQRAKVDEETRSGPLISRPIRMPPGRG